MSYERQEREKAWPRRKRIIKNAKDKEGFVVFAVVVHDVCRCCCCCSLKRGDTLLLARVRICHSTVLLARHLVHLHLAHLYPARHHDMPHHPPTYCCTPSYIYMWVSYGDAILVLLVSIINSVRSVNMLTEQQSSPYKNQQVTIKLVCTITNCRSQSGSWVCQNTKHKHANHCAGCRVGYVHTWIKLSRNPARR